MLICLIGELTIKRDTFSLKVKLDFVCFSQFLNCEYGETEIDINLKIRIFAVADISKTFQYTEIR